VLASNHVVALAHRDCGQLSHPVFILDYADFKAARERLLLADFQLLLVLIDAETDTCNVLLSIRRPAYATSAQVGRAAPLRGHARIHRVG